MECYYFLILDESLAFLCLLLYDILLVIVLPWAKLFDPVSNSLVIDRTLESGICRAEELMLNRLGHCIEGPWELVRTWTRSWLP